MSQKKKTTQPQPSTIHQHARSPIARYRPATIIVLLVGLIGMLVLAGRAWPILSHSPHPSLVKETVNQHLRHDWLNNHVLPQMHRYTNFNIGPYTDLNKNTQQEQQDTINYLAACQIIAILAAAWMLAISLVVFLVNRPRNRMGDFSDDLQPSSPPSTGTSGALLRPDALYRHPQSPAPWATALILLLILLNGLAIRLFLASVIYGNFDQQSYEIVGDIAAAGGNVYAETARYNYSPLWFHILGWLKTIHTHSDGLMPFHFYVRGTVTFIDVLTLGVLLLIARNEALPLIPTAAFFFLNPISWLISGYHGQFENLAMLMILVAILIWQSLPGRPRLRLVLLWLFSTLGLIVKHNILYETLIVQKTAVKKGRWALTLFALSSVVFLATFTPYWSQASDSILSHVFQYNSGMGFYGISSLIKDPLWLRPAFIIGMLALPFCMKHPDMIRRSLLGILFFLSFCTGFGIQYSLLPVALGALRPSRGFFLYTLLASSYVAGNFNNVFVPGLHLLDWNLIWLGALVWFFQEVKTVGITEPFPQSALSSASWRQKPVAIAKQLARWVRELA